MRVLLIILGLICAILGLAMTILPLESLAFIPLVLAFVLGFIGFKLSQNQSKSTNLVKLIFAITILGLGLAIYRTIADTNQVADETENIQQEEKSLEEAKEELEDIEFD